MNESSQNTHTDVAILGAGISGLTAAYYTKRKAKSVRLIESSSRVGGSIRSEKINGYLLEYGPNTVLPTPEILEMVHELDLNDQLLLGDPKLPRFIQIQGKLHLVPMSPSTFFKTSLLSKRGRLRILAEPFIPRGPKNGEEPLLSFATRRIGKEGADRLLAPFVSGVWAGDPQQLSALGSFPKLVEWERDKGSLFRGMMAEKRLKKKENVIGTPRGLLSFTNGLEMLPSALAKNLEGDLSLNRRIENLSFESGKWVLTGSEFKFSADKIILSLPAYEAASLLKSISFETAQTLLEIPYAPLTVLHLSVKTADVKSDLHGFGHLIAPSENLETLGCLYTSSIFSNRTPKDTTLLTVFVGGARFPKILELSDQELLKKAVTALLPVLALSKHPELIALTRYERAIPQYTIGHAKRMAALREMETKFPGLKFAGNYIGGISVGDVIRQAKSIVA